jgi:hypothetical protein
MAGLFFKIPLQLNIKPEILKLVQERAGNTLELIGIGNWNTLELISK